MHRQPAGRRRCSEEQSHRHAGKQPCGGWGTVTTSLDQTSVLADHAGHSIGNDAGGIGSDGVNSVQTLVAFGNVLTESGDVARTNNSSFGVSADDGAGECVEHLEARQLEGECFGAPGEKLSGHSLGKAMMTGDAGQALKRSKKVTAPLDCTRQVVRSRNGSSLGEKILRVDAKPAERISKSQQRSVAIPPDVSGFSFHIYLSVKTSGT